MGKWPRCTCVGVFTITKGCPVHDRRRTVLWGMIGWRRK